MPYYSAMGARCEATCSDAASSLSPAGSIHNIGTAVRKHAPSCPEFAREIVLLFR